MHVLCKHTCSMVVGLESNLYAVRHCWPSCSPSATKSHSRICTTKNGRPVCWWVVGWHLPVIADLFHIQPVLIDCNASSAFLTHPLAPSSPSSSPPNPCPTSPLSRPFSLLSYQPSSPSIRFGTLSPTRSAQHVHIHTPVHPRGHWNTTNTTSGPDQDLALAENQRPGRSAVDIVCTKEGFYKGSIPQCNPNANGPKKKGLWLHPYLR